MLNSPFLQRNVARSLLKTNKFTFNSLVTNLEKTVSTINQVIPLYNQVKPLISSSKSVFSKAKNVLKTSKSTKSHHKQNTIINVEATEVKKSEKKEEDLINTVNINTPPKPFFI